MMLNGQRGNYKWGARACPSGRGGAPLAFPDAGGFVYHFVKSVAADFRRNLAQLCGKGREAPARIVVISAGRRLQIATMRMLGVRFNRNHSTCHPIAGQRREENKMKLKRSTILLIAGTLAALLLGGCVVVPAPGYYIGYHHHHDYD